MSAAMLDRGFPTTFGFKATAGFELPAKLSFPPAVRTKEPFEVDPDLLGWKGLLEFSRTSGASGVLGVQATVEDSSPGKDCHLEICCTAHTSPAVRRLVKSVVRGLKACQEPEKTTEGMGGTYFFMNDCGRKMAIMKPCDEEPLAPNNPKGYVGRALGDPGWKPTVRVGEAAMREVAAYLLDHDGFAKVPTSVLVRARHPVFCYNNKMSSVRASCLDLIALDKEKNAPLPMKLGSLQEFVYHDCDTSELGSSRFSVKDVQRIGILDIRLFNTDRHAGNMLVRVTKDSSSNMKGRIDTQYELIPIDHGFCLPETLEAPYFEWLHWPQAMLPFGEEELQYIRNLDIEADKELLRKELPNLRPECLRVMEVATTLLKRGAEAGLTLYEIASIMSRPFEGVDEEPSELEKFCAAAQQALEEVIEEGSESDPTEEGSDCDSDCPDGDGIFNLEEEASGHVYIGNQDELEAHSPSAFSMDSSISSGERMSFGRAGNSASGDASPSVDAPVNQMARSVHVTDGFLWRRMKGRQVQHMKHRNHKRATAKLAPSPQAYPPPVVALSPESLNGLFSGMNERKWHDFMSLIEDQLDQLLNCDKRRQALKADVGVAMSCPRF